MGESSKIEWTDHTFNPWVGCQKVSPGCDHCYAEALMDKRYGKVQWGPHGERKRTSEANWKLPLRWAKQARSQHGLYPDAYRRGCSVPRWRTGWITKSPSNGGLTWPI